MVPKSKVLVVEDHRISQRIASLVLSCLNCYVEIVSTAKEAISLLSKNEYDIVFMDLGLPDMSGLKATSIIRQLENEKIKNIPIIALTAHTKASFAEEAKQAGMDSFIEKPLIMNKTLSLLTKYIPRHHCTNIKNNVLAA